MLEPIGGMVLVIGLAWTGYALSMNITTDGVYSVYNFGLLAKQQIYVIAGSMTTMIGVITLLSGVLIDSIGSNKSQDTPSDDHIDDGSHDDTDGVEWNSASFFSMKGGEAVLIYSAIIELVSELKKRNPGVHPKVLTEKYDKKARRLIEHLPEKIKHDFKRAYYAAF